MQHAHYILQGFNLGPDGSPRDLAQLDLQGDYEEVMPRAREMLMREVWRCTEIVCHDPEQQASTHLRWHLVGAPGPLSMPPVVETRITLVAPNEAHALLLVSRFAPFLDDVQVREIIEWTPTLEVTS